MICKFYLFLKKRKYRRIKKMYVAIFKWELKWDLQANNKAKKKIIN